MSNKIIIVFGALFVLSGCMNPEPLPEITRTSTPIIIPPPIKVQSETTINTNGKVPRSWLPPSRLEKKWTAVIIHHSATPNGNAAIFDKWHSESNHWVGVGYDFVIGNGTDSTNGQVEVTFRWREQRTGAHCKTPGNWANENAVGICLVGNFNQTSPTTEQMQSLEKLVRFLQIRYGIPKNRIYGHNTTPGAAVTDCPGRNFSMAALKSRIGS